MSRRKHWDDVHSTKSHDEVSWYQPRAETSLRLIAQTGATSSSAIIDVGGGASTLTGDLLADGYRDLTVLDISAEALQVAKGQLGPASVGVNWLVADVTKAGLPHDRYDIWHDRAVFHFLTDEADRDLYLDELRSALRPGGHVIIATFAEDGPEKCSGLPVQRYSEPELAAVMGDGFELLQSEREVHGTPFGTSQSFVYCVFRDRGRG